MDLLSLNTGNGKINDMQLFKTIKNNSLFVNILYTNILIFILINLLHVIGFLLEKELGLIHYLGVSANLETLSKKPWTIISYMFVHIDFLHLFVNLFWLYFGGKIFIQYLSQKQLLSTYIMGGILGSIIYIIAFNVFPVFDNIKEYSLAVGASASVLAILFAIASYVPNYSINLTLLGSIKLKHIAIIAFIIDILSIPKGNAGGHIAHIGGAIYGYIYILMLKRRININYFIEQIILLLSPSSIKKHKKYENDYEYNARKKNEEKEINKILEKISRSGYESLSSKEKEILFKYK